MKDATTEPGAEALSKSSKPAGRGPLQSEKGKTLERPTVYKGFYIFADQYVQLLERSAYNKIHGLTTSSSSDLIRAALDLYFEENRL